MSIIGGASPTHMMPRTHQPMVHSASAHWATFYRAVAATDQALQYPVLSIIRTCYEERMSEWIGRVQWGFSFPTRLLVMNIHLISLKPITRSKGKEDNRAYRGKVPNASINISRGVYRWGGAQGREEVLTTFTQSTNTPSSDFQSILNESHPATGGEPSSVQMKVNQPFGDLGVRKNWLEWTWWTQDAQDVMHRWYIQRRM